MLQPEIARGARPFSFVMPNKMNPFRPFRQAEFGGQRGIGRVIDHDCPGKAFHVERLLQQPFQIGRIVAGRNDKRAAHTAKTRRSIRES